MDYYSALEYSKPTHAMYRALYEKYIEPLLTKSSPREYYNFFLDQGYKAWRANLQTKDIENIKNLVILCEKLLKDNEAELIDILSEIIEQSSSAHEKLMQSEADYFNSSDKTNDEQIYAALRHYKRYYELELRLWTTIPYYFLVKNGITSQAKSPESFVYIAASVKHHTLSSVNTIIYNLHFPDLVDAFDNDIRNAGEGHDSYDITDKGTILLKLINPRTGKFVKNKFKEITLRELKQAIDNCRKNTLLLVTAVYVFINNNEIHNKLKRKTPITLREIKQKFVVFADDRWFSLTDFVHDNEHNTLTIKLKFIKRAHGKSEQILFSSGEKYDVINVKFTVQFSVQLLGCAQLLFYLLKNSRYPTPHLSFVIVDEKKNTIGEIQFSAKELEKFLLKQKHVIPQPNMNTFGAKTYDLITTLKCPFKQRTFYETFLKAKGYTIF